MLSKVGGSIAFGTISACFIASFITLGAMHFFYKFGLTMFSAFFFSGCFSLFLFVACLSLCGPEGNKSQFEPLSWNRVLCGKKKKAKVAPEGEKKK